MMKKILIIIGHLLFWTLVVLFFLKFFELDLGYLIKEKDEFFWPVVYGAAFNALIFYGTCFWLIPTFLKKHKRKKFYWISFFGFFGLTMVENVFDIWWIKEAHPDTYGNETPDAVFWTTFFFNTITNILYFAFAFAYRLPIDKRRQEINEARLEKEKLAAELKFLKAQVDPHTLFNGMNSIYHLIDQDPEKAKLIVLRFSDLIRYQLYECESDFIDVEQEINYLRNYIEINRIRKEEDADIFVEINQEEDDIQVAPLIFTAFIENGFKFLSSHSRKEENILRISLQANEDKIEFEMSNTVDAEYNTENPQKGIGIENTVQRLNLLYGENYELKQGIEGNVYRVRLMLVSRV